MTIQFTSEKYEVGSDIVREYAVPDGMTLDDSVLLEAIAYYLAVVSVVTVPSISDDVTTNNGEIFAKEEIRALQAAYQIGRQSALPKVTLDASRIQ